MPGTRDQRPDPGSAGSPDAHRVGAGTRAGERSAILTPGRVPPRCPVGQDVVRHQGWCSSHCTGRNRNHTEMTMTVADAGTDDGGVTPRADRPRRRTFSAGVKAAILAECDASERAERGAISRREGLYASHIIEWRKAAGPVPRLGWTASPGPPGQGDAGAAGVGGAGRG